MDRSLFFCKLVPKRCLKEDQKLMKKFPFEGILRLSKLLNSYYFVVSYKNKRQFDAVLLKFFIGFYQLRRNKGVKATKNRSEIPPNP